MTKEVLTTLYDTEKKAYVKRWLTQTQYENLPCRYCLPHEVEE